MTRKPVVTALGASRLNIAIAAALAALALAIVLATQRLVAVNQGAGWDGYTYVQMAKGEHGGGLYAARIGYPLVARHLGPTRDVIQNFKLISLVVGTVYGVFSYLLLTKLFPHASRISTIASWTILNWSELGPIRMAAWYPANTDIPFNFLFLVLVWLLFSVPAQRRVPSLAIAMFLVFVAGSLVRENFPLNLGLVLLVLTMEAGGDAVRFRIDPARGLVVGSALGGVVLASLIIHAWTGQWPWGGPRTGKLVLDAMLKYSFVSILEAVLSVYGFALLFAAAAYGLEAKRGFRREPLLVFLLVAMAVPLSFPDNAERLLFWYQLVVVLLAFPFLDAAVRAQRWFEVAAAMAYVAAMHRFFFPIHTTGGVAMDSGCAFTDYLRGGPPHLLHHIYHCPAATMPSFLLVFVLTLGLILLARVRLTFAPRSSSPLE